MGLERTVRGDSAIAVRGLTKRFGRVAAVDDLSFEVEAGSVFAFLGANGAGKSTTISCLTTVLPFDAGTVEVAGHDVVRRGNGVREAIGVVFQDSMLDPILTGRENLQTRARFYSPDKAANNARIQELSRLVGLEDFIDRRYSTYSGGQRRRVDIARALLYSPSIIFLDEPTAGLDPASRAIVWSTIHDLRENQGLTVFLTTHYMEETEEADRVCVIEKGRIIADGTPTTLRAQYSRSVLSITSADPGALRMLARETGVDVIGGEANMVRLAVERSDTARELLAEHGGNVLDFEFRHGTMDDVFLALTGRTGDAE
ncbi:ATP-binding cassette domain-containing protein [Arthrobacter zhangbolii]|uniref:ABC transporter ATP-binding protein n=1 Tax=Arthrobacter zhangbolii TaxID=2886936 RepID=UPI001D13D17D